MKRILVYANVFLFSLVSLSSLFAQERIKIAVIPKGTTHVFWKSIEAGARKAEKEFNVEIVWKGPLKENDRAQQIAIIEQFISEGINGIAVAPLDDVALVRPLRAAMSKKIPVVIYDSGLQGTLGTDYLSYIATDNRKGGTIAGKQLVQLLKSKGKVVVLRYQVGSASTDEREAGFFDVVRKEKEIEIIVDNRFSGATAGEAKAASMNMLDKLQQADGIFCPNESSTFGMLLALRQSNLAGKKIFVGFDTSPLLIEALEKGELHALIAQNPRGMGYESVKALALHVRGKKINEKIDTGVFLVTKETLKNPEIQAVLQ